MCFSPQRRAILRHQNFKKQSENDVLCTFSLQNALLATAACNFAKSELQKVVRTWCVLYIFTSKCASRHSGVQFFICLRNSYLRTRRFNRPTFRLTRHTNHWKTQRFATSLTFRAVVSFFFLTFALLHLLSFDLTARLICFSTLHIVGSLLFKLPSTTPVVLRTTKYYSSTTPYYKVLLQY